MVYRFHCDKGWFSLWCVAIVLYVLFCLALPVGAQTLTEEEVSVKLARAAELYRGKQYSEGYLLAKSLLQEELSDDQREDVGMVYAQNGYFHACGFIRRDVEDIADYGRGRAILEEIRPYASETLCAYLLPKIPLSWYFEGACHATMQQHEEALRAYGHALAGYRELGKRKEVITVLKAMAAAKGHLYDITGAEQTYQEALSLAQGGDTRVQMEILQELWDLCSSVGDAEWAGTYAARMDSLMECTTDAKTRFTYYNKKGVEAQGQGALRLAEQWFLRALAIAESETDNAVSVNRYLSYFYMRSLYAAKGQYANALDYARKSLHETQKLFTSEDYSYYLPYQLLAEIYRNMGDRERCFACLDSLFLGTSCVEEPRELSMLYGLRAACSAAFGDLAAALTDYRRADEVLAAKYPASCAERTRLLPLMGGVQHRLGNYAESERLYRQYATQATALHGDGSMESVEAQIYLANAEGFAGHVEAGSTDYAVACDRLKALMHAQLPYLNSQEREAFWKPLSELFTRMTPYALQAGKCHDAFTADCYDALVLSKSFLLEAERSLADAVRQRGSVEDKRDLMQLILMRNRMRELERDYVHHADSLLALSRRVGRLADRLIRRCRDLGDPTDFMNIDYRAVKKALVHGEVLVDFTDFESETLGRKYAAYIINKEDEYPLLTDLFAERQMDSLGLTRPDMYYDPDYAPEVLRLLWEPLRKHVPEGATIYYVPSQLLFRISPESLPLADGTMLGSHYRFVRLSSARELVKGLPSTLSARPHTAILYGGLHYDLHPSAMQAEAGRYDLTDLLVMRGDAVRGDSVFRELPGSQREVLRIDSLLRDAKWQSMPRMGMEGTEESFLSMHGRSPQVLQIATHGFYYTPDRARGVDYLRGYSDAMSLSGLVLSGGNAAWLGRELPKGVLGGILTAANIARLDLRGTEMVVLSACQSGQGRATSEGLYGLQRAFKKAGAGTMVMALWNVSDRVATEFMTTFYEQLASKQCRWNKRQAFERTRSLIREKYPDPFQWAAFVMVD